jgi:hypothetical protein
MHYGLQSHRVPTTAAETLTHSVTADSARAPVSIDALHSIAYLLQVLLAVLQSHRVDTAATWRA